MNPSDPTNPTQTSGNQVPTTGFFSGGSDVPPPPQAPTPAPVAPPEPIAPPLVTDISGTAVPEPISEPTVLTPASNMPPAELLTNTPPPVTPPPPSVSAPTPPPPSTPMPIVPSSRRGFPMKILLFVVILLLGLGGIGFLLMKGIPQIGGQKTITWWGLWEDAAIVAPLISEYEAANPNVKVKYVKQSKEEYRERLTNSLSRSDGPDIFRFHQSWVPMFRSRLAPVPSSVMSAQEFAQTYYPVAVSTLTESAGIVGMPLMYDGLGLFINDEIFATYGKSTPVTWYDVRDIAIELTIKDEEGVIKQSGVALGRTENVDHWQEILALMMLQNGVNLNNPTGEFAEQALRFYAAFSNVHGVWDETLPSSTVAFAGGKVAMYIGPSWRAHEIRQQQPNLKFRVVPVPQLPKQRADDPDITYATFWAEGVNEQSKVKDEAWKFLKFLSTKESLTKMYTNATNVGGRAFGEIYPRRDMQELLLADPLVSGIISLAPNAKSWYLASRTFDGQTGINSQLSKYFEDAVNSLNQRSGGANATNALIPVVAGVQSVLVQYGLIAAPPVTK